jgi:hypothetical protein
MTGQWNNDVFVNSSTPVQKQVDTISTGTGFMLDSTVISFVAVIIHKGIATERKYNGNIFVYPGRLPSGTVILIDQITAIRNGVQIRLPARKFVIR